MLGPSRYIYNYYTKRYSALGGNFPFGMLIYITAEKRYDYANDFTDFSPETQYLLLLFVILPDENNEARIGANDVSGCTGHYTEKRNDVGEYHIPYST